MTIFYILLALFAILWALPSLVMLILMGYIKISESIVKIKKEFKEELTT